MENLIRILEEIRPDLDFTKEQKLIDEGVLDSFDIITIVSRLNEEYDIEISVTELLPENLNSAEAIWGLVERLKG